MRIRLSCIVSETFNVEKWRALEIWVRGHSRSLEIAPLSIDRIHVPIGAQHFEKELRAWLLLCLLRYLTSVMPIPGKTFQIGYILAINKTVNSKNPKFRNLRRTQH